ncbi:MAG: hypothetical protein KAI39_11595, partial [Desulfobulbaceae bacterium]|nr:hypothetical protein [Desulfobulbaceae bacterium]
MPAPVLYHDATVDPYSHHSQNEKTTSVPVLYATNRKPHRSSEETIYSNGMSDILHLGEAQIRFGDQLTSWEDLYLASTRSDYPKSIHLSLEATNEIATIHTDELYSGDP